MPYFPSHMGFGLMAKAIKPSRFSLVMFGATQALIDVQPLLHRINPEIFARHFPSHTIIGATVLMFVCVAFREPLGKLFKAKIDRSAAFYGAGIGVYSHLILDCVIHPDVSRIVLWPLKIKSQLYARMSEFSLVILCLILGAVGIIWLCRQGEIKKYINQLKDEELSSAEHQTLDEQ